MEYIILGNQQEFNNIKVGEQILCNTEDVGHEFVVYVKWDKTSESYEYDKANIIGIGVNDYVSEKVMPSISDCYKSKLGGGSVPLNEKDCLACPRVPIDEDTDHTFIGCTVVCQEGYKPTGANNTIASLSLAFTEVKITCGGGGITPTGEIIIDTNGTYDVTNYASASINVPTPSFTKWGFPYYADRTTWKSSDFGITQYHAGNSQSPLYGVPLTKIEITNDIEMIDTYSLAKTNATEILIDCAWSKTTNPPNYLFANSTALNKITFSDKWTRMRQYWYNGCANLTEVHIYGYITDGLWLANQASTTCDFYLYDTSGVIALNDTPRTGHVFHVPATLYSDYCAATRWSTITGQIIGDL